MARKGGGLRTVYGVFFALLTLFVGALFIMQVWSIYRSSTTSPYTVENISKHFEEIAIPVWVWLGGLVVNILLALLLPSKAPRIKAAVDGKKTLERVKARVPKEGESFERAYALSRKQKVFRVTVVLLTAIFMLAAVALCVLAFMEIYYRPLVNKPFFAKQKGVVDKITQTAILSAAALTLAAIASGLISLSRKREQKGYLAIIADGKKTPAPVAPVEVEKAEEPEPTPAEPTKILEETPIEEKKTSPWAGVIRKIVGKLFLEEKIAQEEIDRDIEEVVKGLEEKELPIEPVKEPIIEVAETVAEPVRIEQPQKMKKQKPKKPLVKEKKENKPHKKGKRVGVTLLRIALAAAGVALVVLGIFNGGMEDVLLKAINICTQCIGLG